MSSEDAPPSRPATLEDVALVAGVSRATVSRVVNGARNVDPTLRSVVEKALATTRYVPNRAARSLVTRRTDSIALVVSEREHRSVTGPFVGRMFSDPYFGRVVTGMLSVLRPAGVQMVLMLADDKASRDQLVSYLRQGHVDGVVLITSHDDDPLPGLVSHTRLPAVLTSRPARPTPITYVDVDQRIGAKLAADHLASLGRRRIGTVSGPLDMPAAQERLAGFRVATAARGIGDIAMAEGDFTQVGGGLAMKRLLEGRPDLDGVFIASDLMAMGALPVLHGRGRRVPEDVAVVGFDDSDAALACEPALTTVRQPVEEMSEETARLLLRQMREPGSPPPSMIYQPSLVIRASA